MTNFKDTASYNKLQEWYLANKNLHLRDLFLKDANRFSQWHIRFENMIFDFSKNRLDKESLHLLLGIAEEMKVNAAIDFMFSGGKINRTENRSVLHTALRNQSNAPVMHQGMDIMLGIKHVLNKMKLFSESIISGSKKGYTGKQFTDVVNIGIGGSDLGPLMVCEALKYYNVTKLNVHFVSNVDGTHITETLKHLNPETTLFLIASKTFTTQETMANAHTSRRWFLNQAKSEMFIADHFVALSTAKKEVQQFGIELHNMFEFWDWVGGRYSLWSSIGLSVCMAVGYNNFEELLKGAYAADQHFRTTSLQENIPVLMALIGLFNIECLGCNTHAVIPYDQYLHRFPAYLQQTDMESNGKHIDTNGNAVNYSTGPIIWGEPGTNGQHAFFQLLHQGTQIIPCDFIAPAISLNKIGEHHDMLMANFFAQSEAFMNGKTAEEVMTELRSKGMSENEIAAQTPFRVFEGNRPSNTFLVKKMTPYQLGSLIAMYEHKIFMQGVLWNIYSFDQWGVELGKKLAMKILPELKSRENVSSHDSSTNGLINQFREWNI